jgi:uncharacterized protein YjiS (DUF1127 family)
MSTIYRTTGLAQTTVSQRRDSSALKNFWGAFQEWRKWERLRRDLCNLSDRELMDIGITRGGSCRSPAVRGKRRCRMHGGAPGSGAPRANQNARRHGLFTGDAIAERKQIQALLGEARKLLQTMK